MKEHYSYHYCTADPNPLPTSSTTVGPGPGKNGESLLVNFQDFAVEQNATTIGWVSNNVCFGETIMIEGYTVPMLMMGIANLPGPYVSYTIDEASTAQIPADQLLTPTGEPIVYRIIAVDENGAICSDRGSQDMFYRFDCTYVYDL